MTIENELVEIKKTLVDILERLDLIEKRMLPSSPPRPPQIIHEPFPVGYEPPKPLPSFGLLREQMNKELERVKKIMNT